MTGPFRETREPCRECARRAADPKEPRKPMAKWVFDTIAIAIGLLCVWGVLLGSYFVGDYSETGRGFLTLLGIAAGLIAIALGGIRISERDR